MLKVGPCTSAAGAQAGDRVEDRLRVAAAQSLASRQVVIGRERLRQLLRDNEVSWQRTRTWKESTDPDFDAKLDRIEEVTFRFPQRCFAFDQFGPLSIRPHHG